MPFIEQIEPAGPWTRKTTVGLKQVEGSGSKTYFEFTENFAYTTSAPIAEASGVPLYDSPLQDLIVRMALEPTPGGRRVAWKSDLASIPKFLWSLIPSYGRHTIPALMHDALCDEVKELRGESQLVPLGNLEVLKHPYKARRMRRRADRLFRITLADVAGMKPVTRWLMWTAVRLFGVKPLAIALIAAVLVGEASLLQSWVTKWNPSLAFVSIPLLCAAAVFAVLASWEFPVDNEWDLYSEDVGEFQPGAFRSLLGASLIGGVAAIPLTPFISVTFLYQAMLLVLDAASGLIAGLRRTENIPDTDLEPTAEDESVAPGYVSTELIEIPSGPNRNLQANAWGDSPSAPVTGSDD